MYRESQAVQPLSTDGTFPFTNSIGCIFSIKDTGAVQWSEWKRYEIKGSHFSPFVTSPLILKCLKDDYV